MERFWSTHGWTRQPVDIRWRFETRSDFEAVVRIELPDAVRRRRSWRSTSGTEVDYAVNLWWRRN